MRLHAFVSVMVVWAVLHLGSDASAQRNAESRYGREIGMPMMEVINTGELPYADVMNWGCVRDQRGMLWLANTYCLLEYDGLRWDYVASDNTMPFFTVACGDDGTIYYGMFGEFGRLSLDSLGGWELNYLSDSLPSSAPRFTSVNQCIPLADETWFVSPEALCKWDGSNCSYILPQTTFKRAFPAHGKLYVYQDSIGICRIEGGNVVPVRGGDFLADATDKLIFLFASASGDIVLGNRRHGIFRYDGHRFRQIMDYAKDLVPDCIPSCGIELADGTIALGTDRHGIWIVDTTGALIAVIDKEVGLPDNSVNRLYQDDEQNIWVILDESVVRIEWPAKATQFSSPQGIDGIVADMVRYNGVLYAGTTQGLFRLEPASVNQTARKFRQARFVAEDFIQSTVHDFLPLKDQLLIASEQGVFVKTGGARPKPVAHRGARKLLLLSGSRDTVLVGAGSGYYLLIRRGDTWITKNFLEKEQDFVINLCEDAEGRIWAGTARSGARCIKRDRGILNPDVSVVTPSGDMNTVGVIDIQLVFGEPLFILEGEGGMWLSDSADEFIPADELQSLVGLPVVASEPRVIFKLSNGRYWVQLFSGLAGYLVRKSDGRYALEQREDFLRLLDLPVYETYVDPDGVFWLSSEGRVIRLDPSVEQSRQQLFKTLIREISVDGVTLYNGNTDPDSTSMIRIDDDHRRVVIWYTAPNFGIANRVGFQYRVDGLDTAWTAFSSWPENVEYMQLPPGDYVFRVRVVTLDGIAGEEATAEFTVLVPWYRTWWAFLVGGILFGIVVFGGPAWYRSRFLKERSRELEMLVAARTEEIQSQAREISWQAEELERLDNIVRTVNRETQLPFVLDALLMQSLLLFPHADVALFVRREMKGDVFRVIAAVGRNSADLKERTFTLRDLVGSVDASLERMREGVYFLHGLGKRYLPENSDGRETHFMAMVIERARLLEGFLVLGSNTEDTFGESDLRRLMRLKEHASSAIAKAGAIEQLEEKNKQLDTTNRRLLETQRQLVAHEKLAALGELTAGIAHEIQNPLNFVNNFSELSCELLGELEQSLKAQNDEGDPQSERLIEQIRSNCKHIREHGRRATSIVSAMIMHSRSGMSQRSSVTLNDLVDEFVMLAYHGMRLQFPQFTLDLHRDYDKNIGEVEILPQDLSRVIVNICNNAWEAALNRAAEEGGDYVPTVNVQTRDHGSRVQISITDNGHGIPEDLREKIFEPFFTTRRSSRNAGLGLSLSYDIVTQLHGGELTVHSTLGSRTEFRIIIPREAPK